MYKSIVSSMQRGARSYDKTREPDSNVYQDGAKIMLAQAEKAHLDFSGKNRQKLTQIRAYVRALKENGFRQPKDVSRLLNKASITTTAGAQWSPRLVWFLLKILFDSESPPQVGKVLPASQPVAKPVRQPPTREPKAKKEAPIPRTPDIVYPRSSAKSWNAAAEFRAAALNPNMRLRAPKPVALDEREMQRRLQALADHFNSAGR